MLDLVLRMHAGMDLCMLLEQGGSLTEKLHAVLDSIGCIEKSILPMFAWLIFCCMSPLM